MHLNIRAWLHISLVNLCIVALLGVVMRYKIGFEFPFLEQKNLQHSHSHFAFAGWVTQTLMVLMLHYLQTNGVKLNARRYCILLSFNLAAAYGMLVSFIVAGYAGTSITFSLASILCGYLFGYFFLEDLKKLPSGWLSKSWFKAAIGFNWLSSLGTFALAYMMASKNITESLYLSSIYFYLHFHYNGWFFFACLGLLYGWLRLTKSVQPARVAFLLFAGAAIPAFGLSVLWLDLPILLYGTTVIASVVQLWAWILLLRIVIRTKKKALEKLPTLLRVMLQFVAVATSVKIGLQLVSVIPWVSELAFGFRPIVIAYLHLVLLAMISLFLLGYIYAERTLPLPSPVKTSVGLFSVGVVTNEIVLGIQGVGALGYVYIPYSNEILFGVSLILLAGISGTTYFTISASKKGYL